MIRITSALKWQIKLDLGNAKVSMLARNVERGFSSLSEITILMPTATSLPIPSSYYPVIERAKELPEIKEALSLNPEKAIPLLKRGTEIFQMMVGHGSGEEYRAICFLLARVKGLCGLHDSAVEILTELRSLNIRDDEYTDISFALSKALFNAGNFVHAIEVAESFSSLTPEEDGYYSSTAILRCGSFRYVNVDEIPNCFLNKNSLYQTETWFAVRGLSCLSRMIIEIALSKTAYFYRFRMQ